ncbi:toxic anion resistance protein [Frankia sp. AgB1.9]|uniref:toxic anion resistance protein n=1 Tax=unclassified Frankia TaxID=2632575 RepID=UPI0019343D48|nr:MULTISPECIES: toxic anion resistance protein [unclassified Frankia]MBL7488571.1 toxic anion resistance protein [Frankia sp. AgW1.1]MBL7550605.1 toxic anion resistance protein [Frankia sp. AgB1.9]MBL7619802.1 toxic anion resistance protein [Frankia sp. AgB1.8]
MSDALNLGGPLAPPTVSTTKPGVSAVQLTPPAPVAVIPDDQVDSMVPIDESTRAQLRQRAAAFADELASQDPRSPAFQEKINDIARMGEREIIASARVSNRMLDRPAAAMKASRGRGGPVGDAQTRVAGTLVELRHTVTDLDPGRADLKGARKLLGMVPMGNKIAAYFQRYQSAQKQLDAIITALGSGQDELRQDNAAIEQEKANLWAAMGKLTEYATLAKALDGAVTAKVEQLRYTDPQAAEALSSDGLFPIRQRQQDLLTQLAVSVQGYLALDLVRKNNIELIKGVDRAQTTTVAALRTAVIVAQALANQKLVLDQINALNATTNDMIVRTSELLRTQSAEIQEQAASSTVSVEALQTAFDNIFATMDAIDTYRAKAVDSMATTVAALETQVGRSKSYLERARANER